ncbi:MAG: histidine kinase, partial [Pedobacter sp.]
AETGQRGYLLSGDKIFLEPYNGAKQKALTLVSEVAAQTKDNAIQQKNAAKMQDIIEKRLTIIENTINVKERGGNVSVAELLAGKEYMDAARLTTKSMQTEETRLLELRTADLNKLASYTPTLIVFAAICSLLITFFFYRKVSTDFNARMQLQQALQDKNEEIDHRIEVIQGLASQISAGNYSIRLEEGSADGLGSLAGYLNAMAESLQYSFALLNDKEWLQAGIANLNDKMVGEKSVADLATDILGNIVDHTNSQVAALYLLEDKDLRLAGSYALEESQKREIITLGVGITGQAAESGKQMLLNDIPEGKLTISYASGHTVPKNIVAVPIFRNLEVVGVMEFGSISAYT